MTGKLKLYCGRGQRVSGGQGARSGAAARPGGLTLDSTALFASTCGQPAAASGRSELRAGSGARGAPSRWSSKSRRGTTPAHWRRPRRRPPSASSSAASAPDWNLPGLQLQPLLAQRPVPVYVGSCSLYAACGILKTTSVRPQSRESCGPRAALAPATRRALASALSSLSQPAAAAGPAGATTNVSLLTLGQM